MVSRLGLMLRSRLLNMRRVSIIHVATAMRRATRLTIVSLERAMRFDLLLRYRVLRGVALFLHRASRCSAVGVCHDKRV